MIKKKVKSTIIIFLITFSLLIVIEGISRIIYNVKILKINDFSSSGCHLENNKFIPNCAIKIKRWENKRQILYKIDDKGYRESSLPYNSSNKVNFVFFGDSFTYGDMNNEKENYVYLISNYIKSFQSVGYQNRGFPGLGFLEILDKIKRDDLDKFDYIVYGMTPNDVYSLKVNSINKNSSTNKKKENYLEKVIISLKSNFNLRSVQAATSIVLKNDMLYEKIWKTRKEKDFINNANNDLFKKRYDLIEKKLQSLKKNKKEKLIIVTIPQKIQIVNHNLGYFEKSKIFENKIEKICKNLKIRCILTLNNLKLKKKVNNTHFTVDGHLTAFGNKWISELIVKDKNFSNLYK